MKKVFLIVFAGIMLCGCNSINESYRVGQAMDRNRFDLGMSYNEVVKIVGRKPDPKHDVIKEESAKEGTYKTWILHGNQNLAIQYNFTFLNDKLVLWNEE